jgi:hypothetical protein
VAAVTFTLATVGVAAQARIPHKPPAEQSRCAPVHVKPSVLVPGHRVKVSVGPATDQCGGAPSTVTWSYPTNVESTGFAQVRHCKARAVTCVYEVFLTSKTMADHWYQFAVAGSSPQSGWASSAPYYIKSSGYYAITGRVFDKLRNGLPHQTVRLSGPSVHQTFHSLQSQAVPGYFSFAVKKKGTYTLTVKRHGKTARTTVHVHHKWNITEVDF